MRKTAKARYTLEFKQEAVRLVEGGQSIAAAARTLGMVDQTLTTGSRRSAKANSRVVLPAKETSPIWALFSSCGPMVLMPFLSHTRAVRRLI